MNLIFHIASAIAAGLLVFYAQSQLQRVRLLRRFLHAARGSEARWVAEEGSKYLRRCCEALAIPWQGAVSAQAAPAKIDEHICAEFFLRHDVQLVRFSHQGERTAAEIDVHGELDPAWSERLSAAFANRVSFSIRSQ